MTYYNIDATLCYEMQAPFLIDNSFDVALKNFSYTKTNIVQDFQVNLLRKIENVSSLACKNLTRTSWFRIGKDSGCRDFMVFEILH